MRTHIYCVTGIGQFPIDMLRYDQSYPYSETDSAAISGDFGDAVREVWLVRQAPRDWRPTAARWESFLWMVVAN